MVIKGWVCWVLEAHHHPLAKLLKILIPTGGMEIDGHKDVSHLHVSGSV
jgi:hypothetical protein